MTKEFMSNKWERPWKLVSMFLGGIDTNCPEGLYMGNFNQKETEEAYKDPLTIERTRWKPGNIKMLKVALLGGYGKDWTPGEKESIFQGFLSDIQKFYHRKRGLEIKRDSYMPLENNVYGWIKRLNWDGSTQQVLNVKTKDRRMNAKLQSEYPTTGINYQDHIISKLPASMDLSIKYVHLGTEESKEEYNALIKIADKFEKANFISKYLHQIRL